MITRNWHKIALVLAFAIHSGPLQAGDLKSFSIPQNQNDPAFPTSNSAFVSLEELATKYWPKAVEHVLVQEGEKNLIEKLYAHGQIVVSNYTNETFQAPTTLIQPGDREVSIGSLDNIAKKTDGAFNLVNLVGEELGNLIIKIRVPQSRFVLDETTFGASPAMIFIQSITGITQTQVACQSIVAGNIALLYNFVIQQLLVQHLNNNANIAGKHRVLFWKPGTQEYPRWKLKIVIKPDPQQSDTPIATVTAFDFGVDFINPLIEQDLLSKVVSVVPNGSEKWKLGDDNPDKTALFVKITKTAQGKTEIGWARERMPGDPANAAINPVTFLFNRPTLIKNAICPADTAAAQ